MAFDPTTARLDGQPAASTTTFDPTTARRSARSALGEIANQGYAGAVVELPQMVGKAAQYLSNPGSSVYDWGKGVADSAAERGNRADLQPDTENHGLITNTLASGARMIPQSLAPAAAAGLIAAAPVEVPAAIALGGASLLGALPAAFSQGQTTLDKAKAAGVSDDVARDAARKTAAFEFGGEALGNFAGGKLLGLGGKIASPIVGKVFGQGAKATAGKALEEATSGAVIKPFLKSIPGSLATEVGTEMGQNAGEAYVERAAGISKDDPWEQAKEAIGPTVGMTALLLPFGLVGHSVNAHTAKQRAAVLTSGHANQESRAAAAEQIQKQLAEVDPAAAANFGQHAAAAISAGSDLQIGEHLFQPYDPYAATPTQWGSSLGASDFNGQADAQPNEYDAPQAPDYETTLGAGQERNGLDFQRDVDTSGLSLVDPQEEGRARAAGIDFTRDNDTTSAWTTTPGAAASRMASMDFGREFDTGGLSLADRPARPSELMGLNPSAGPISAAAAMAVDSGAYTEVTPITQRAGIGAQRRLAESPIIDVDARVVEDPAQSIATPRRLQGSTDVSNALPAGRAVSRPDAAVGADLQGGAGVGLPYQQPGRIGSGVGDVGATPQAGAGSQQDVATPAGGRVAGDTALTSARTLRDVIEARKAQAPAQGQAQPSGEVSEQAVNPAAQSAQVSQPIIQEAADQSSPQQAGAGAQAGGVPTAGSAAVEGAGVGLSAQTAPNQVAQRPAARKHPASVRGSGALAEVSRALGGISPDLLADLSEKISRTRTTKTGKATKYTSWDNPAIPGVGPLFRRGGSADMAEIARVLEEAGYLEAGANERDPIGAAQRAQEIIRGELRKGGSATQVGNADAIDAEMRARLNAEMEAAMDAESDPWDDFSFTPDDLEASGYTELTPELQSEVERLIAEADQAGLDSEAIREDVARQVGEEASQDEYNAAVKEAIQGLLPRVGRAPEQTQPGRAQQGDRDSIEAAGDQGQEGGRGQGRQGGPDREALTLQAQTEEDLRAKAEREDAATKQAAADKAAEQERLRRADDARDNKARADATVDDFQLGQSAEQQMSGMGDLFSASSDAQQERADVTKLTQDEAKSLMSWQDLGQKDGVKTHALTFYESQADKDAKRGRMNLVRITKGDHSDTHWQIDGDDRKFAMLGMAKKAAEEIGMARAVSDGFVQAPARAPASQSEAAPTQAAQVSAPTESTSPQSTQAPDLEPIFDGLQSRGLKKKAATEAAAAHPMAERIALVDKHILDILGDLDESGVLNINC